MLQQPGNVWCNDWIITVAFYAAMHWVEGYFARKGLGDSRDHGERQTRMARLADLKAVYGDYCDLYFKSRTSRYGCKDSQWADRAAQDAVSQLQSIEQHMCSL